MNKAKERNKEIKNRSKSSGLYKSDNPVNIIREALEDAINKKNREYIESFRESRDKSPSSTLLDKSSDRLPFFKDTKDSKIFQDIEEV